MWLSMEGVLLAKADEAAEQADTISCGDDSHWETVLLT